MPLDSAQLDLSRLALVQLGSAGVEKCFDATSTLIVVAPGAPICQRVILGGVVGIIRVQTLGQATIAFAYVSGACALFVNCIFQKLVYQIQFLFITYHTLLSAPALSYAYSTLASIFDSTHRTCHRPSWRIHNIGRRVCMIYRGAINQFMSLYIMSWHFQ